MLLTYIHEKMKSNVLKNTIMLYGLGVAKIVFPLITLPYLTRVLTTDAYGVVAYVKATMQYMQLFVDFGFMLSGTKDIVNYRDKKDRIGEITGTILGAKIILGIIAFLVLLCMIVFIPLLRNNAVFTMVSFIPVFLSIFLFDYLFRGLERMEIITVRFIVMKGIAIILTFVLVNNDKDILWIPLLDTIGTLVAIILVWTEIRKLKIRLSSSSFVDCLKKLIESATYFASNMATTAFGALNTLVIGIVLPPTDVAYWSVCMQLIGAVQTMYSPITDGIYPEMVRNKDSALIKKVIKLVMPIIFAGCIFAFVIARYALLIVGGKQYIEATHIFRLLIPVLVFSFPAMLFGWPTLGALGKIKEVTISTIISAVFQVMGLVILAAVNSLTLVTISVLRVMSECVLMAIRLFYTIRFKESFIN